MTTLTVLNQESATRLGVRQYECPYSGDESGIILVVDRKAFVTDCFDVMSETELEYYTEAARAGELPRWNGGN